MNAFAAEAFFIGLREGFSLAFCMLLAVALFRASGRGFLEKPLFLGILAALPGSAPLFALPVPAQLREFASAAMGYVFGLCYLLALGIYALGTRRTHQEGITRVLPGRGVLSVAVFSLTAAYLFPDMIGACFLLRDLMGMSGRLMPVTAAVAAGLLFGIAIMIIGRRLHVHITKFVGWPQFVLLLAMVKLFGGGAKGFGGFSLIPTVQAGLMKFVHDTVHHVLVTLMVPDHQILSVTAWNFIGLLFGEGVARWLSLALFTVPLLFMLRAHAAMPIPVPGDVTPGPMARRYKKKVFDARILKAVPAALFLVFITGTWFAGRDEAGMMLVSPAPVPVMPEAGRVVLPISTPGRELRDGGMHKFSLNLDAEEVRLFVMQRGDGTLAVCLDACEICPPDGYAVGRRHVICRYCSTPIPVDTLGRPGGCNPIPLKALVTESSVLVEVSDIAASWEKVKARQTGKEAGK